ncbi:bacterio-opsin activator domain-containing protein [Halorientalis brevis]|uniref:Bacterio-opsin activator domain-containing protein n=1 Tax=Halorientalis brevis TaxID=1126241 RepID=A0ABD6CGT2_9EURY|nr:bacterio-opsin activator domain-containing protein [Halorientalis brevis]
MDDRLQRAPVGVLEVSPEGTVTAINDVARGLIDVTADPSGVPIAEVFPRSVEDTLLGAFEGEDVCAVEFEEYYPDLELWLAVSVVPTDTDVVVYLQDVTRRQRYEQSVERLRTERKRITLIDEVLSKVLAALVDASTREEIAETICRELGDTALYEFAWVGEREIGSDDLTIRAAAGDTGETFAAVRDALTGPAPTPEERAVESGQLQAADPLADDAAVPERVRMAGFADGVQSALAIPLVYGANVYGVVGVYADGTDAFSDRERRSFETLGEVAGFAVTAARNRNLLLSDSVTEVTFSVGADSVMASLSGALDTEYTLDGMVPRGDETLLCYTVIEGAAFDEIAAVASDMECIGDVRAIGDSQSDPTVELEIQGSTPLLAVSSLGGTVRRARFDDGTGQIVVDLPPESDVHRMSDAVSRTYDADVVAKRERERSVTTAREFRDELDERLTERQRVVLRTAYLADYFESPRGSTAEEVATSLDITGSTLLHHLRASQRKLLDAYFQDQ